MFKNRDKKRVKDGFTDEKLNIPENNKSDSFFKISLLIIICTVIFFCVKLIITYSKNEINKHENMQSNLIMIPNIIGLDIDNAKEILNSLSIKNQIEYSKNDFFDIDSVMKMSLDPGTKIEKGSTIILYVCKNNAIKPVEKGSNYFKDLYTEDMPVRKNEIIVKNIYVEDNELIAVLNNDSDKILESLRFTVGYVNQEGTKFLNKPSMHININIKPYEDFKIKQKLKNPSIKGITIEKIDTFKKEIETEGKGD